MKFLDSNILTYAFYDNEFREQCQEAIKEGGTTNTFCLAETFQILEKIIDRETAIKSIKSIKLKNTGILHVTTTTFKYGIIP